MEIVRIIVQEKPTLYSVKFSGAETNEFDRCFDLWNDPEYLRNFFKDHSGDLRRYNRFHNKEYGINEAVRKTIKDAENLENRVLDVALNDSEEEGEVLQTLFRPLNDMETGSYPLQKEKGKLQYESWLRMYAVRIDVDLYVMSGGAIKLTYKMQERDHTSRELRKLDEVVNYLRSRNLINEEAFERLELR